MTGQVSQMATSQHGEVLGDLTPKGSEAYVLTLPGGFARARPAAEPTDSRAAGDQFGRYWYQGKAE